MEREEHIYPQEAGEEEEVEEQITTTGHIENIENKQNKKKMLEEKERM